MNLISVYRDFSLSRMIIFPDKLHLISLLVPRAVKGLKFSFCNLFSLFLYTKMAGNRY